MFKTLNELPADSQERIGASPAVAERLFILAGRFNARLTVDERAVA